MSMTPACTARRLFAGALFAIAFSACADEAPTELGIYDQLHGGKKEREETPSYPKPQSRPDAAAPTDPPQAVHDASAAVEADASVATPPPAGKPGLSFALPAEPDPALRCFPLLAHAVADANQPYAVPKRDDLYVNFTFDAPFQGTQYVRTIKPVISESVVIHRFRLFQNASATAAQVSESERVHTGASLLTTWAPNGDPVSFAPNTGIRVRGDVSYTLEIHYRNLTAGPVQDRSGVELCVTALEPPFLVGLAQLAGQTPVLDTLTGTCTPTASEPIQLLGLQPQFDPRTKHIEVTAQRSMAAPLTVWDEDTSFDLQRSREANFELRAGDTLTTTCTRKGANEPGSVVNEPACNVYVFHWPAHALISAGAEDASDGIDTCLR